MTSSDTKYPFLHLTGETATSTNVETKIIGKVPAWLEGSLYRNGPGVFQVGVAQLEHLFDGFATLHHYRMSKGKVWYTARVLDTETWTESVKANRLTASQFATYQTPDPCKSAFAMQMSFFKAKDQDMSDNSNVSVVEFGDALYALSETPWVNKIDPKTLKVTNKEDMRKVIAIHWSTAHPLFDKDGTMYNMGTSMVPNEDNYHIVQISPKEGPDAGMLDKAKRLFGLKSRWKFDISYNHSFGMSRDHFVILEQPVALQPMKMQTTTGPKPPKPFLTKYPTAQTVFRVVRRSDNKEVDTRFCTDPTFCFHFVNCHEEAGHLVVDLVGYTDLNELDNLELHRFSDTGKLVDGVDSFFQRYVLPLNVKNAKVGENLVTLPHSKASAVLQANKSVYLKPDFINNYMDEGGILMELPRINNALTGSKYRYAYGSFFLTTAPRLMKIDLDTREVKSWIEAGYQPGEPVFVPRPGATREDDGVILSPVLGERDGQNCYLLILDATSFEEIGRAVFPDGVKMSATFHGSYVVPKTSKS